MGAGLLDGQGVHVRAQADGAIARPGPQNPRHPCAFAHVETKLAQGLGDARLGPDLLEAKLGILVKPPAKSRQAVLQIVHVVYLGVPVWVGDAK